MKFYFLVLSTLTFLFHSCTNKHSEFISNKFSDNADSIVKAGDIEQYIFQENGNKYVSKTSYYEKGELLSFKGYLLNSNYGSNFYFSPNGKLFSYSYATSPDHSSYSLNYTSKIYLESGTPLVDFWRKACDVGSDSLT